MRFKQIAKERMQEYEIDAYHLFITIQYNYILLFNIVAVVTTVPTFLFDLVSLHVFVLPDRHDRRLFLTIIIYENAGDSVWVNRIL